MKKIFSNYLSVQILILLFFFYPQKFEGQTYTITSHQDHQSVRIYTITLKGTFDPEGKSVNKLALLLNTSVQDSAKQICDGVCSSWSISIKLKSGTNEIILGYFDNLDKFQSLRSFVLFKVLPPTIVITSHAEGQIILSDSAVIALQLVGPVEDLDSVKIGRSGIGSGKKASAAEPDKSKWTGVVDNLTPGINRIYITAYYSKKEFYYKYITLNYIADYKIPLIPLADDTINETEEFWVVVQVGDKEHPVSRLKLVKFTIGWAWRDVYYRGAEELDFFKNPGWQLRSTLQDYDNYVLIYSLSGSSSGFGQVIKIKYKFYGLMFPGWDESREAVLWSGIGYDEYGNSFPLVTEIRKEVLFTDKLQAWPGDADGNGNVEIIDINKIVANLWITGPPSPEAYTFGWRGYWKAAWAKAALTFTDCNGDGIINLQDINPLVINFGKKHRKTGQDPEPNTQYSSADPPLYTKVSRSVSADELFVDVNIGTSDKQTNDVQVVSFELLYDKEKIKYTGYEIGSLLTESYTLVIPEHEKGKLNASVYKLEGGNSGPGNIIRLKFRTKGNDICALKFNKILASKTDGSEQPLYPIDFDGVVEVEEPQQVPSEYKLSRNYPNPFNPGTRIRYELPEDAFVSLKVYDALGSEVASLVNEQKTAGTYIIEFNAIDLPAGIYIYKIHAGKFTESKKMLLLK